MTSNPAPSASVNNNDTVTRVPPRELSYSHVGTFLYFDAAGAIHSDISWWYKLLDGVKGRIEDFLKPGTDGINDHSMEYYLDRLKKNIDVYPKL